MDDFDIYADLPDFAWLKQEYEADVDVKKEKLPTSEEDVIKLKTKLLKLEKVHKLVLSHYSSLWKTAKQERKRMERQIAELRSQLDNLAFKRNHRQTNRNTVPLPVPVNAFPASAFPASNNYQFNYPPPLISQTIAEQQIITNLYSYPPPPIHSDLTTNQDTNKQEETPNEDFVDNLAASLNAITPENSHSSDESEDEIVKKSEYRSTVYGERLRKKLLEEKRNAARQTQEALLNEKKISENKLDHQETKDSENLHENKKLNTSKDMDAVGIIIQKRDIGTIKEKSNNRKPSEIDAENAKASYKQNELKTVNKIEVNDNRKNNELTTETKNDTGRKKNDEDSISKKDDTDKERTDEDFRIKKERDLNQRKQDEQLKIEREGELEKKREDESRISRERDLERRRKEEQLEKRRRDEEIKKRRREQEVERKRTEESDKRKREEVDRRRKDEEIERKRKEESDKRKREEVDKRRKDEEIERKRKEESDKRKREEVDRRRKDEEIERRKKEEIDKRRRDEIQKRRKDEEIERRKKEENDRRRREDIEKRRKDEEIERRKKEEIDKRRREEIEKRKKEDIDRKRKEEEIERRKREEIAKKRREEEAERLKKEEEQHAKKLKEIEKNRNEKQLEELIKERERIEQEMKNMMEEETEEGEITESFNDRSCKEPSVEKKSQDHKEELEETCSDKSKQSQKNQTDNRRNDDCNVGRRITRSNSSRVTNQTINDNHRKGYHEYGSCKSDSHQDNHINYDKHKHSHLRSRRDQLDLERERRKSSHRYKSRNRNRSDSGHRSDEDRVNYSPKRIRLQEKDRDHRDKLKDTNADRHSKIIGKSPKRRRQTKSDERSPQSNKRRKMSPGKDLDCNIKSNKNDARKTNAQASNKLDDGKNIIDDASSNQNTSSSTTENVRNLKDNAKEAKEKLVESLNKDRDEIANKLTNPQKDDQVKDSNEDQVKHTNPQTDKKGTNHANKMKCLMNELFEDQEKPVHTSVYLKQVKNFEETSDETILTELEDGEMSDSGECKNSENIPKVLHSQSTNKTNTVNLFEKNKFAVINSKNKLTTPLQKNNEEIVSKSSSEVKDSILSNMLAQSSNNNNKESSKIELDEKASNKKEAVVSEDDNKPESYKEIANKTDNTSSSQIINEKQIFVNETSHIKCTVDKSSETSEINDVKKNVLSEVNESKAVSERSDKINTIIEKEKQSTGKKPNVSIEVDKADFLEKNIFLEQPRQNCLKVNNSENKIDDEDRLQVTRTELHGETNNMKNTCLKENVKMNNDFINKRIGQSPVNEGLHEESCKPVVKSGNTSQDNAAEKSVNTSQTKVSLATVKTIIVIRRRRRPVQLSDSPPVVVINNMK